VFAEFIRELEETLKGALPAHEAHRKVMNHRKPIYQLDEKKLNARQSAVLIHIYPKNNQLHTVFIQRPIYEGVHSGQIALPGGKAEEFDAGIEATALREADEELNIKATDLKVIGKLTPIYVPPSNFMIHPVIGYQESRPNFVIQKSEVASFIECKLEHLIGEEKLISNEVIAGGNRMNAKGYQLNEHFVWGATGMMIKEFAEILDQLTISPA